MKIKLLYEGSECTGRGNYQSNTAREYSVNRIISMYIILTREEEQERSIGQFSQGPGFSASLLSWFCQVFHHNAKPHRNNLQ